MRIAFIGQKGIPVSQGGVERHVEELARSLVERGHEVIVYSRRTYKKGYGSIPDGVEVVELPSVSLKAWDTVVATLLASLDVLFRKVDVVHYHSLGPAFFMFLPWLFKPSAITVFTHHTTETLRPQWGSVSRFMMKAGEIIGMKLADEVVGVSPTVSMDLERLYQRRVSTVPNGVTELPQGNLDELGLPPQYILTVSRLIRSKGIDHLIRAFNLLSQDYPEYHLVIVGSSTANDNDEQRLKKLIKDNKRVHFLGWQPSSRLGEIYTRASVFVQPSEIEGLPITLLEAAVKGVPVVASDIPAHSLVVRSEALLFKNKSHIDLASQLRKCIENESVYKKLAARLSKRIIREYNWKTIAKKIESIYYLSWKHKQKTATETV